MLNTQSFAQSGLTCLFQVNEIGPFYVKYAKFCAIWFNAFVLGLQKWGAFLLNTPMEREALRISLTFLFWVNEIGRFYVKFVKFCVIWFNVFVLG